MEYILFDIQFRWPIIVFAHKITINQVKCRKNYRNATIGFHGKLAGVLF